MKVFCQNMVSEFDIFWFSLESLITMRQIVPEPSIYRYVSLPRISMLVRFSHTEVLYNTFFWFCGTANVTSKIVMARIYYMQILYFRSWHSALSRLLGVKNMVFQTLTGQCFDNFSGLSYVFSINNG